MRTESDWLVGLAGRIWPDGSYGYSVCKKRRLGRSLGLSDATIYHKRRRNPRGSRGITSRQRRAVRSAVILLEFRFGRKNLSFGTVTLPGLSEADRIVAQQNWARSVQVFLQSLRRHYAQRGFEFSCVAVTEIHPSRSEREGWAAPHLHFVFRGRETGKTWIVQPNEIRRYWARAWRGHFSTPYDWKSSENVVAVRKSAAAYLAKYISKRGVSPSPKSAAALWFPSSWISITRGLKAWLRLATVSIRAASGVILNSQIRRSVFSRSGEKPIRVTNSTGFETVVGAAGWVPANEWIEIVGAFWPEKLSPPVPV